MQNQTATITTSTLLRRTTRKAARAFTLIEILVVLAIAGMIVGVAVYNLIGTLGSSKEKIAKMAIDSGFKTVLMQYNINVGDYPSTADGLQALITPPNDKVSRWGKTPYIDDRSKLIDPWGEPYQYRCPGTHNKYGYDLWSKGPDKQDGTADDIGNWEQDTNTSGIPGMPGQ